MCASGETTITLSSIGIYCLLALFTVITSDLIARPLSFPGQMYPSIQAKIWGNMGQVADLLDMVLDSFIKVCTSVYSNSTVSEISLLLEGKAIFTVYCELK